MKERPILFSSEMVRAILEGRKTQTRRIVKNCHLMEFDSRDPHYGPYWLPYADEDQGKVECPYGKVGDRLWVREAFRYWFQEDGMWDCIDFLAGGPPMKPEILDFDAGMRFSDHCAADSKWRPSIHMPRWASRLTLEVTDIRVERLQYISEEDAKAEGILELGKCNPPDYSMTGYPRSLSQYGHDKCIGFKTAVDAFHGLWDSINASRGYGWDSNPWVWVVEFRRVEQ